MSIASAIATKQQQVADCYTVVSDKGGTLPANQNLTNLANTIDSISGGGDLIFAENRLGRTPVNDEKVLLTRNTNLVTSYTGSLNEGNTYTQPRIYDNICYNVNNYSNYSTAYIYQNGAWTNYRAHDINSYDPRFSYIFNNGVWYQHKLNSSNFNKYDEKTGIYIANGLAFLQLNDTLKIKGSDGKIYSNDETQSYTTGIGDIRNSQKMFQLVDNILVCFLANGTIKFIDITNFPNCTETVYNLPHNDTHFIGVSGTNINDFAITVNTNTLVINKLTSNGYEEYQVINILNGLYALKFDININRIVGLHGNFNPFILQLNNNSVTEIEIPAEVRKKAKQDLTSSTYGNTTRRFFVADKFLTYFGWSWSTGDYNNYTKFCAMGADGVWYFTEPTIENYQNVGSFTGFVTGNVDQNNKYEIKTILPKTVIINCSLTINDSTIIPILGVEGV